MVRPPNCQELKASIALLRKDVNREFLSRSTGVGAASWPRSVSVLFIQYTRPDWLLNGDRVTFPSVGVARRLSFSA